MSMVYGSESPWDTALTTNKGCLECIDDEGDLRTTLFEKKMALYLFITPNSAHPLGITAGFINGEVLRIYRLRSEEEDVTKRI
ncbi:hypothetical protein ACHAWF_004696, partial [Thalassiosira exigua]